MVTFNPDIELTASENTTSIAADHDSRSVTDDSSSGVSQESIEQPHLPPTDHSKAAWLVLAGCSVIQAPVWGFSLSFGVFQDYYMNLSDLEGSKSSLANIGTCASGILYLSAPVTFTLLTQYPRLRRFCGPVGLALTVVGSILSSFATNVWHLIATQGVICALGSGLLYSPTTLYLDEWFVQRKGLAYGVMLASKSLAGAALPFLMGALLDRFGFRTTMRAWAVASPIATAPLLYFLRPRTRPTRSTTPQRLSLSFLTLPSFWILQTGNILQSLGYFLPSTYLASYASTIGLKSQIGTLMIALLNATSVPGSLLIGMLNDRCHVTNVILISTIGSTLAVLVFWGLADQVSLLAVFAILYGFFAGGFSATWSGVLIQMKQEMPALETGLVFGLLAGGRGIGNVISGPLSTILIDSGLVEASKSRPMGYETQYGWLIVFTGITALLGGWGWMWRMCQTLLQ